MGQLEVLEQRVQLHAVEVAPRAVEVLPGLGLLPGVAVVLEVVDDPRRLLVEAPLAAAAAVGRDFVAAAGIGMLVLHGGGDCSGLFSLRVPGASAAMSAAGSAQAISVA